MRSDDAVLLDRHGASHTKVEKIVLKTKENLWKINLNFVNDMHMIYIHLIIIVIIVLRKSRGTLLSCRPSPYRD